MNHVEETEKWRSCPLDIHLLGQNPAFGTSRWYILNKVGNMIRWPNLIAKQLWNLQRETRLNPKIRRKFWISQCWCCATQKLTLWHWISLKRQQIILSLSHVQPAHIFLHKTLMPTQYVERRYWKAQDGAVPCHPLHYTGCTQLGWLKQLGHAGQCSRQGGALNSTKPGLMKIRKEVAALYQVEISSCHPK